MNSEWKLRVIGIVQLLVLSYFSAWAGARAFTDKDPNWYWFYVVFAVVITAGLIYRVIRYRQRFKPLF